MNQSEQPDRCERCGRAKDDSRVGLSDWSMGYKRWWCSPQCHSAPPLDAKLRFFMGFKKTLNEAKPLYSRTHFLPREGEVVFFDGHFHKVETVLHTADVILGEMHAPIVILAASAEIDFKIPNTSGARVVP